MQRAPATGFAPEYFFSIARGWRWSDARRATASAAYVVEMAVAEPDGVGVREIDAEDGGVVEQGEALPGVEEHAVRAGVDPEREPVLAHDARAARGVFREDRECDHGWSLLAYACYLAGQMGKRALASDAPTLTNWFARLNLCTGFYCMDTAQTSCSPPQ